VGPAQGTGPFAYDVHVNNCTCQGVFEQAIGCINGIDWHIEGCSILGNNIKQFGPGVSTLIDCELSEVNNYLQTFTICNNTIDCRLINAACVGIAVNGGFSSVPYAAGGGGIIANNTIVGGNATFPIATPITMYGSSNGGGSNMTIGISTNGSGMLIANNTIAFAYQAGINCFNGAGIDGMNVNNVVTGNNVYAGGYSNGLGIAIRGGSYNYVTNNFIHCTSPSNSFPGTWGNIPNAILEDRNGVDCHDNYIANNYLEYNGTTAPPAIVTQGNSFLVNNYLGGVVTSSNAGVGISRRTTTISTLLTLHDYLLEVTGGSGVTVTLPTAANPVSANQAYIIKNTSSNTVTIATTSGQTIDSLSPGTLPPNGILCVYADGANYKTMGIGGALQSPVVFGEVSVQPTTVAPLSAAKLNSEEFTGQTTSGSHTAVVMATIPLPGTVGSDAIRGQMDVEYDVSMMSTSSAVGARFKGALSWAVQTSGSPVAMGTDPQPVAIGTNSGSPPSGWAVALQLDGGSQNVQVAVTGDASLTVDVHISLQWKVTN
jgi:hypothetical protein